MFEINFTTVNDQSDGVIRNQTAIIVKIKLNMGKFECITNIFVNFQLYDK